MIHPLLIAMQTPMDPGGGPPTSANWGICIQNGSVPTLACVPILFQLVINAILSFAGVTSLLMLMYSGIRMVLARGDAKALETTHRTFFFALIGLLVVLLSFFVVNVIGYITGLPCINQFGFNNCLIIPSQ